MDEGKYILEYNEYRCVVEKFSGTESVYWGYIVNIPILILVMGKDLNGAYECLVEQVNRYMKYLEFGRDGKGLWK